MKILFGVFDWGLGHATRDIPLIEELLKRGNKVDIISTGRALILLKNRFGKKCKYFEVPSLFVPYSKSRFFSLYFAWSIPKLINSLIRARKFSSKIIIKGKYDKIISDCRYDVYDKPDNSYFINHQLRLKTFAGAQAFLEKWLALQMNHYKFVFVPDFNNPNLSGILSHNLNFIKKSKIKYIGILSHLNKNNAKEDIDYFISISGPEPQRTVLEEKIMPKLNELNGKIVISLGKPEKKDTKSNQNITTYSFLDSKKQGEFMNRAKFIITRSGYTTVMEIVELNKKKVLMIPTPGQTEQEYLSELYEKKNYFHSISQYKLDLKKDIAIAKKLKGFKCPWKTKESVNNFMQLIEA